jgi:hypothetical protein
MGDGVKRKIDRRRTDAKVLSAREALPLISTDSLDDAGFDSFNDEAASGGTEESGTSDHRSIQVTDRQHLLADLTATWARRRRR